MPSKEFQYFYISTGTMLRFLVVILGMFLIYIIRDIVASLFFAIIIASAIEPSIEWFVKYRLPRILAVILVFLFMAATFSLLIYFIFPILLDEIRNILISYPTIQRQLLLGVQRLGFFSSSADFNENFQDLLSIPTEFLALPVGGKVFDFASAVFGGALSFVAVVIFSFYLAIQEKGIENFLRLVTPLKHEEYVVDLWDRSQKKLGRWLRAQLLLGALVGIFIFFGLTILGVEHAFFFAILAGVFEIIPVAGPILAAIPAVATALIQSPILGLFVILFYAAVQQTESHVIVPVVMKKTIGLNSLVVVLALLVGARIGGAFGLLLAVPITAVLVEFVNDWDRKKRAIMAE